MDGVPGPIETSVLVVGGGPVGMTLALDLSWRGIDVVVAERRPADDSPSVRCGQISARSMEVFRRLGVAETLRGLGLPADYPNDIVSATSVLGIELSRVSIPARGERGTPAATGPDTLWRTPEHTHRVNQKFFEPALFAYVRAQPRIRVLNCVEVDAFTQREDSVEVSVRCLNSGEGLSIACRYLVGCDGAGSMVRKAIGAEYMGTPVLQYAQSTYIRAPTLRESLPGKPAWLYFSLNPRRCGVTMAVDGRETWNVQNYSYPGEPDLTSVDRDWATRMILGVGPDFHYDVLSSEDWVARRLVADRFSDRRVFICGDAAHLWIPLGGYGMNAGIADAANLAWKLAGVLNGWAAAEILDSYNAERQPITDQVSRLIEGVAHRVTAQRDGITADIERRDAIGEAARAQAGAQAYALDMEQQCCGGLNFGYYYDKSPIIAYDEESPPAYTMGSFTSSTVPGCRVPHLWLDGHRSLYDAQRADYTLLRLDPTADVAGIVESAARRSVPLAVVEVNALVERDLYRSKLVLVRSDQHVAWRGDREPAAPLDLIDLVRGAGAATAAKPT